MGRKAAWEKLYGPSRFSLKGAAVGIKELISNSSQYIKWLTSGKDINQLLPETGIVIRKGLKKIAVYKDEKDQIHAFDATCSHLGCIVRWNDAERSWDCPCHGSRYNKDGKVINGPAINDLKAYDKKL
jgi:Rieske Fe-S protein